MSIDNYSFGSITSTAGALSIVSPLIKAKTAPTTLTVEQLKIPKMIFKMKNALTLLFLALKEKIHDGMLKAKKIKQKTAQAINVAWMTKYAASIVSAVA